MKVMKNEKVNIYINGDENTKNEIIYNNILDNLKLTEKDELNYLKDKVINLEIENKNKILTILLILVSILGITFGCYLLIIDIYVLGIIIIASTFIGVMLRSYLMFKNMLKVNKSSKYERIEHLRKLLESKLK